MNLSNWELALYDENDTVDMSQYQKIEFKLGDRTKDIYILKSDIPKVKAKDLANVQVYLLNQPWIAEFDGIKLQLKWKTTTQAA